MSRLIWIGVTAYSVYALSIGLKASFENISRFSRHNGKINEILLESPNYRDVIEIENVVPPGSRVQLSHPGNSLKRVAARYHLYPMKITDDWQYFVDFKNANSHVFPRAWLSCMLSSGGTVYALPGNSFTKETNEKSHFLKSIALIAFVGIALFKVLTGYLLLKCMDIQGKEWGAAGYVTMSYLVGELLLSCAVWGYLLFGGSLTRGVIIILWASVALILFVMARRHQRALFKFDHSLNFHYRPRILPVVAMGVAAILFLGIITQPVIDWDAMSFWIMKSKVIYHQRILDLSYTHNNHYPMLWPVSMAAQFFLLGEYYDQMAQWTSGLFFMILIAQMISVMKFCKLKPDSAAIVILLFLAAFFNGEIMHTAKAENLFLAYTAGLVTSLVIWFKLSRRNNYAWLAVLMAAALTMIKFEGFLTSVFVGLSLLLLNVFRNRDLKILWFPLCLLVLVPLIEPLWVLWCRVNGYFGRMGHLRTALSFPKVQFILKVALGTLVKSHIFIIMLFAAFALMLKKEKLPWKEEEKFLLYLSSFLFSFSLFFAYVGLTRDQIVPEVIIRLSTHASPVLAVLWCSRMFRRSA